MGSLKYSEIEEIYKCFPHYGGQFNTFIETGTYMGETLNNVQEHFTNLYSVENNKSNYNISVVNTSEKENIHVYFDNSENYLTDNTSHYSNTNTIFFIDAHSSGNITCPILRELDIICTNIRSSLYIFIINDERLFDKYTDWKGITKESILNVLNSKNINVLDSYVCNDKFIIISYC